MDFSPVLSGILVVITVGAVILYYRLLRGAKKEYENAKEAVEDVVLSFNRQLKHEASKVEMVAYKVEALSARSDTALKRAEAADKAVQTMYTKFNAILEEKDKLAAKMDEVYQKTCDVATSHADLATRVSSVEAQTKQFSAIREPNIEAVIPIRRDKALAPLTETELAVLEMLASEGSKTAPEIKDRVELSREHTARLMKKLYEGGYLERDTNKIPFKYSVKKEMEKLLKKTENEVA